MRIETVQSTLLPNGEEAAEKDNMQANKTYNSPADNCELGTSTLL